MFFGIYGFLDDMRRGKLIDSETQHVSFDRPDDFGGLINPPISQTFWLYLTKETVSHNIIFNRQPFDFFTGRLTPRWLTMQQMLKLHYVRTSRTTSLKLSYINLLV